MENELRVAIASDLHAVLGADGVVSRSHLRSGVSEDQHGQQPIGALFALIEKEDLKADLLICPGDLGDAANPEAIRYAWGAVHRVGNALGVQRVLATTGNHDVDSRRLYNPYDPIELLKNLDPPYPIIEEALLGNYWTHHFCVVEEPRFRLVLLNSSAFHATKDEEKQGRISDSTLTRLEKYLSAASLSELNFLVCHHHPQQHSELKLGDYDWMRQGQQLLDLLGSGSYGSWIVIHGHKHHPKITYAAGGSTSPVVFSAGSFSAALYAELGTEARNQFYLLTFEPQSIPDLGLRGRGRAWDWATSQGWVAASAGSGLPADFGFGCRESVLAISSSIARHLQGQQTARWETLMPHILGINHLLPSDLRALSEQLRNRHSLKLIFDQQDRPYQIARLG